MHQPADRVVHAQVAIHFVNHSVRHLGPQHQARAALVGLEFVEGGFDLPPLGVTLGEFGWGWPSADRTRSSMPRSAPIGKASRPWLSRCCTRCCRACCCWPTADSSATPCGSKPVPPAPSCCGGSSPMPCFLSKNATATALSPPTSTLIQSALQRHRRYRGAGHRVHARPDDTDTADDTETVGADTAERTYRLITTITDPAAAPWPPRPAATSASASKYRQPVC
jgi:hypothetical protein